MMKKFLSLALLLFSLFSFSQIGIGTTSPSKVSQLDVTSTTKGLLPPRMTYAQRNAIVSPPAGLQLWCTDCGVKGEMQVFNGTKWVNPSGGETSSPLITGSNAYCDGQYKTQVVEKTSSTGQIWMDRNLGASRAATSSTDRLAYGCLYQWGRGNDGHSGVFWTSSTVGAPVNAATTTLSSGNTPGDALFITAASSPFDWRSVDSTTRWQTNYQINNPCPTNFRVPSNAEFQSEITALSLTNATTAYNSIFKFVTAGNRENSGSITNSGSTGYYWTSKVTKNTNAFYLFFNNSVINVSEDRVRIYGHSVRCIKI